MGVRVGYWDSVRRQYAPHWLKTDLRIVYGESELQLRAIKGWRGLIFIPASFCKHLHAKCWMNESICTLNRRALALIFEVARLLSAAIKDEACYGIHSFLRTVVKHYHHFSLIF